MKALDFKSAVLLAMLGGPIWCQSDPQPIYRVTVVSRTLPAVNYEHRGGPTMIDFQGTVLLPRAKGSAVVESKRGRVVIDAKFEHLEPPTRFGREYLTYVLWAISPEGRPRNLGELLVGSSDKAKTVVTTELQSLGLMVTAEPYYAVTTPSDVVVLENVVRPDTVGRIEPVTAKYELLPRGQYTLTMAPGRLRTVEPEQASLPYDRYEAVLELYQAQNAIQIARSAGADQYAADTIAKADSLLAEAQEMEHRKQDLHMIVSRAREAAQMAEDARTISYKRSADDRVSSERERRLEEGQARERAEEAARQARAEAAAAREAAEQAAVQAQTVQQEQAQTPSAPPPPIVAEPVPVVAPQITGSQRQARAELLERLNGVYTARDTPRGLVVTLPDSCFESNATLKRNASERLGLIANMLSRHGDLTVYVEGFTDDRGSDREQREISERRAREVRATLVGNGLPPIAVQAVGFGGTRPLVSNASASGREQNRRVEIVISGPAIGGMALWDRTYSLSARP
ncbi:MAG TPA: OmpA family protein [Bryobacteraceae bacterium]|nr:OmpA family protein [Bryobacteraceae bacterium]